MVGIPEPLDLFSLDFFTIGQARPFGRVFVFSLYYSGPSEPCTLQLGDTQVYEPEIRALLGTASHFCEASALELRTVPNGTTLGLRILRAICTVGLDRRDPLLQSEKTQGFAADSVYGRAKCLPMVGAFKT